MKTNVMFRVMAIALIIFLIPVLSCQKSPDMAQEVQTEKINQLKTAPQCATPLVAGETIDVEDVTVTYIDASDIEIDYVISDYNWCLTETHLDVQIDPANFPQANSGNPKIGHFSYSVTLNCESGWDQPIDLTTIQDWTEGDVLYIAAHAIVQSQSNETAWGQGDPFPGNSWAMYFVCEPPSQWECGDPLIDECDGQQYATV